MAKRNGCTDANVRSQNEALDGGKPPVMNHFTLKTISSKTITSKIFSYIKALLIFHHRPYDIKLLYVFHFQTNRVSKHKIKAAQFGWSLMKFFIGSQLKSDLKEMEERLEMKIEEAEEAREMNGVYSAKLTRLERKFKKLRDQDEESYIEMTF